MTGVPLRPKKPYFASGPCNKHPHFSGLTLESRALLSRTHRSKAAERRLKYAFILTKTLLAIPDNYKLCMIPGSNTGVIECAIWNMLGLRNIDVMCWDPYGDLWYKNITEELKLTRMVYVNKISCPKGQAPFQEQLYHNPDNDLVFVWNATPTGVCIPNLDWINVERDGLTIVDATSAVFGLHCDWNKIDVLGFSWQKMLGGEGGLGMMVLSPRAIQRINGYHPERPIPTLYRIRDTKTGKFNLALAEGRSINTYSLLLLEDYIMALEWVTEIGGVAATCAIVRKNHKIICDWVNTQDWIDFIVDKDQKEYRSPTTSALRITNGYDKTDGVKALINFITGVLEGAQIAYDIKGHKSLPNTLRIWTGPTICPNDLKLLLEWITWCKDNPNYFIEPKKKR